MSLEHQHNISYGGSGLTRTISKPVEDREELRRIVRGIGKPPGSSQGGPSQDKDGAMSSMNQKVPTAAVLIEGVISYVFPGAYSYRVMLAGNLGQIVCSDATNASFLRSVRISQAYAVGTSVVVLRQSNQQGVIMGVPSRPSRDAIYTRAILPSGIGSFHASNRTYVGKAADNMDTARGFPNFAQGRAADICEGEYSVSNAMEGGFYTGPYETSVRQAWDCGIWTYTFDKLLKLVGRSVQTYSTAHERYDGMDESEPYSYEGVASWPWEAYGYYREPDKDIYEKGEANEIVRSKKGRSFQEPTEPDAEPFYRYQRFRGFVGQGETSEVCIPPINVPESNVNTLQDGKVPVCVARRQVQSDGTIVQESAKGIYSIKHVNIRSFKRKRRIDDPQGDDAAGGYLAKDLSIPSPENGTETDEVLRAVRANAVATFRHHEKDFDEITSEDRLSQTDVELYPDLNVLSRYDSVEDQPPVAANVDDVRGDVEYRPGRSMVAQLDNGDIIFRNASGAEIALRGSNIELSAPGDLRLMFGRSVISLSGDDTILRSKNSVDITSTSKDVRIKAENNCDIVGGVSGTGRTLIENQSVGMPGNQDVQGLEGESINGRGLMLKSTRSATTVLGQQLYIRSVNAGTIIVDADEGRGSILTDSRTTRVHASGQVYIAAGLSGSQSGNIFIVRPSTTVSKGTVECHGAVIAKGTIQSDSGVVVDPMMNFQMPQEYPRDKQIQDQVANFQEGGLGYIQQNYRDEDRIGNQTTMDNYAFSFRTDDQYGSSRVTLRRPFWMELYGSQTCSSLPLWDEPVYTYQSNTFQQPWPGYRKWSEESSLEIRDPVMYDADQSIDIDLPDKDTNDPQKVVPGQYLRIINPL